MKETYYDSKIALENLRNNSVCVLVEDGIRNIIDEDDFKNNLIVYVSNILPFYIGDQHFIIKKGEYVRYKLVLEL